MSIDHTSYRMDELDLCKLIAHELSNGPHTVEEIYGMLILLCRLKDKPVVETAPFVQEQMAKVDHLYEPVLATQELHAPLAERNKRPIPPHKG